MKIAVITITRDRLEYTRRAFQALRSKAGYPFLHYVVDNGSEDDTPEYLRGELLAGAITGLHRNATNLGIGEAWGQGVEMAKAERPDLYIKMDNDAEVLTAGILGHLAQVFTAAGDRNLGARFILSPRIQGINNQPKRVRDVGLAGNRVGITGMVGGLFMCVPAEIMEAYSFPIGQVAKARGWDSHLCAWARERGAETGYVEALVVEHMDGTDGQAKKFPAYFRRKRTEEAEL